LRVPRVVTSPEDFTVIGENIHATRVVLRNGRRAVTLEDGTEAVPFRDESGERRLLTVPDWFKETQPYSQGQLKHVLIAMMKGIGDDPAERDEGAAYIRAEVARQIRNGADYLDINVDEVHYDVEIQSAPCGGPSRPFRRCPPYPRASTLRFPRSSPWGWTPTTDGRGGRC
jgi:hypothetical protein